MELKAYIVVATISKEPKEGGRWTFTTEILGTYSLRKDALAAVKQATEDKRVLMESRHWDPCVYAYDDRAVIEGACRDTLLARDWDIFIQTVNLRRLP